MSYTDYFKEASSTSTIEEKIEIIQKNNEKAKELNNKLRELKNNNAIISTNPSTNNNNDDTQINNSDKNKNNEEINKLYSAISLLDTTKLTEDEITNELNKILKQHNANSNTIDEIKLLLYKEYLLYNKMIFDSHIEELNEIKKTLTSLSLKIELLDDLEEEEELTNDELNENTTNNNNIFFLVSKNDNVLALENIRKSVPKEYYPILRELLIGLKNGKLKGVKKLNHQGYLELKTTKIRITFDKLTDGNYIIIDAFMKKYHTSGYYRKRLELRTSQYQLLKNYYLSKINDETFKQTHEKYLEDLLNLLDNQTLEGEANERKLIRNLK